MSGNSPLDDWWPGGGQTNWRPVAAKDVRDAIRSRTILLLTLLFAALFVGTAAIAIVGGDEPFGAFLDVGVPVVVFLVPVVAFGVAYKAILNERRTRTIVLALSLPHSRWDMVVGTLVGRALVLSLPIVAGLAVAGALLATVGGAPGELASLLLFAVPTLLYAYAFLGFALGLSSSTASSRRVTLAAIGSWVVFVSFWRQLVSVLVMLLFRFRAEAYDSLPDWAVLLQLLSPTEAYLFLLDGLEAFSAGGVADMDAPPWFATRFLAVTILLAWIVVPVLLGYRRFRRVEI